MCARPKPPLHRSPALADAAAGVRRTHGWLRALVLAVAMMVAGGAAAADLGPARAAVEVAGTRYDALVEQLARGLARYEERTRAIEAFRASMSGAFDVYELRASLREAQAAAEELERLDREVRAARQAVQDAESALVAALRVEVERLNAELRGGASDVGAIVAQLNALNAEMGRHAAPLPAYTPVPIEQITAGLADTPEEMYDAAAELADHESRMERQLAEVRARLRDAEARNRAIAAAGEFRAEESLLDEGGARRSAPRAAIGGTSATSGDSTTPGGERTGSEDSRSGGTDVLAGGPQGGGSPAAEPGGSPDDGFGASPPRDRPAGDGDFAEGGFDPPGDASAPGGADPSPQSPTPSPTLSFGAAGVVAPSVASAVPTSGREDPTVVDAMVERRRGRRGEVDELRALEQALVREIEQVRQTRTRLTEQARALESID